MLLRVIVFGYPMGHRIKYHQRLLFLFISVVELINFKIILSFHIFWVICGKHPKTCNLWISFSTLLCPQFMIGTIQYSHFNCILNLYEFWEIMKNIQSIQKQLKPMDVLICSCKKGDFDNNGNVFHMCNFFFPHFLMKRLNK